MFPESPLHSHLEKCENLHKIIESCDVISLALVNLASQLKRSDCVSLANSCLACSVTVRKAGNVVHSILEDLIEEYDNGEEE